MRFILITSRIVRPLPLFAPYGILTLIMTYARHHHSRRLRQVVHDPGGCGPPPVLNRVELHGRELLLRGRECRGGEPYPLFLFRKCHWFKDVRVHWSFMNIRLVDEGGPRATGLEHLDAYVIKMDGACSSTVLFQMGLRFSLAIALLEQTPAFSTCTNIWQRIMLNMCSGVGLRIVVVV
jgi:hypothetical protein